MGSPESRAYAQPARPFHVKRRGVPSECPTEPDGDSQIARVTADHVRSGALPLPHRLAELEHRPRLPRAGRCRAGWSAGSRGHVCRTLCHAVTDSSERERGGLHGRIRVPAPRGAAASCRSPPDLIAEGTSQAVKNGSTNRRKARRTAMLIPRSHRRNVSNRLPGLTPEVGALFDQFAD